MSHIWYLHLKKNGLTIAAAIFEYLVPLLIGILPGTAVAALMWMILAKSVISCGLTLAAIPYFKSQVEIGLPPTAFGFRTSGLALLSLGGGAGELWLLESLGTSSSSLGTYRLIQTGASLIGAVGLAVQAPLLRDSNAGPLQEKRRMLGVGALSLLVLLVVLIAGSVIPNQAWTEKWLLGSAVLLGISAILSSVAIVPQTALSRRLGSGPVLKVAMASAAIYWGLLALMRTNETAHLPAGTCSGTW